MNRNNKNKVKMRLISGDGDNDVTFVDLFGRSVSNKSVSPKRSASSGSGVESSSVVDPPFDYTALSLVPEKSDLVFSNIQAIEQNVVGFGYRYVEQAASESLDNHAEQFKSQVSVLEKIFKDPNRNFESLTGVFKKIVKDRETYGTGYLETVRAVNQNIEELYYTPTIKIKARKDVITSTGKILRMGYVMLENGEHAVYYKNFGDLRKLNRVTGKYSESVSFDKQATELIEFKIHSTYSAYYGSPRYISAELAITGNAYSQETNNNRFKNNCVPDRMMIVQNGTIVSGENDMATYLKKNFKGTDKAGSTIIVEVEGYEKDENVASKGLEKAVIEVIELNKWNDADFLNYMKDNDKKIRRVFRLGSIITGDSNDYNRATALASKEFAEEQVFNPDRVEINEIINQTIVRVALSKYEVIYAQFAFNQMQLVDPELQLKKAETASSTKAGSLNEIRKFIGLPAYDDERANVPMYILELQRQDEFIKQVISKTANAVDQKVIEGILNKRDGLSVKMLLSAVKNGD